MGKSMNGRCSTKNRALSSLAPFARWAAGELDALAWTANAGGELAESKMARIDAETQVAWNVDGVPIEADL